MNTKWIAPLAAGAVLTLLPADRADAGDGARGADILQTAAQAGRFDALLGAVRAAGLGQTLQGPGPFTVFAPVNQAFLDLGPATLAQLTDPDNVALLRSVLTYHVVPGALDASAVLASPYLTTVNGQRLDVSVSAGAAFVDGAEILVTDVLASNGVIHVIDAVLQPETQPIAGVAQAAGTFGTLLAAVDAADLEALLGRGPLTVLAPTDAAFAKLDPAFLASLLQPENKPLLTQILAYHVIVGSVYADQAIALGSATTLEGSPVTIGGDLTNGVVLNGSVNVIAADVEASNGVIHVIDTVLVP